MKWDMIKDLVRRDWYLLVILAVVVVAGGYRMGRSEPAAPPEPAPATRITVGKTTTVTTEKTGRQNLTPVQKAEGLVEKYQKELDADPEAETRPRYSAPWAICTAANSAMRKRPFGVSNSCCMIIQTGKAHEAYTSNSPDAMNAWATSGGPGKSIRT